jgi:hypothetical protein
MCVFLPLGVGCCYASVMTKWVVRGADRQTGSDKVRYVDAASRDEAAKIAGKDILVESVEVDPNAPPASRPPVPPVAVPQPVAVVLIAPPGGWINVGAKIAIGFLVVLVAPLLVLGLIIHLLGLMSGR